MFGRGGNMDFGNVTTPDHRHTLPEAEKDADDEILTER
jgi:hypothetical protein